MSNVVYNPLGQPTSDSLGTVSGSTGISETHTFNNRGELTSAFSDVNGGPGIYHLSGITYAPNGDFKGATDSILGGVWNYTYDDFNRLATTVQTSGVAFNYKYDRFGNRWQQNVTAGSGPAPQYAFDANNRIIPTNCTNTTAFCYDAAGNMVQDTFHTYSYDAEGRILTVDATSGTPTSYAYDAMGHRAQRTKGGVVSYFGYDLAGHSIVEYQTNPNLGVRFEAYAAGPRHLVTYSHGFTYFDFQDVVGTERTHVTQEGAHSESTFSLPFGDGQFTWGDIGLTGPMHFTGKERDGESNLDYFGARYYTSTQGRFSSPDDGSDQDPSDPQSWSLYGYVRNNPLSNSDPTGNACVQGSDGGYHDDNSGGETCAQVDAANKKALEEAEQANEQARWQQEAIDRLLHADAINDESGSILAGVAGGKASEFVLGRIVGFVGGESAGGLGPVLKGVEGLEKATAEIEAEGGQVLGKEITVETSAGRARVDLAYKDSSGKLVLGEAKNGPTATLNPNQKSVYQALKNE